eukprot:gene29383-5736_t
MVGDAASDENAILVVPSVLSDNLLIRPHCLGSDIDVHVQAELRRKVEHEGDLLEKLNGVKKGESVTSLNPSKRFEIGDNRISVVARYWQKMMSSHLMTIRRSP